MILLVAAVLVNDWTFDTFFYYRFNEIFEFSKFYEKQ